LIIFQSVVRMLAGVLLLAASGANSLPNVAHRSSTDLIRLERQVYQSVNQERRSRNLPDLNWSDPVAGEARRHAVHIAEERFFAHEDPLRGDVDLRLDKSGIAWLRCGENLYQGNYSDPVGDAVNSWLDSSGHRQNMMDTMFNETGVGVAQRADGWIVIVQEFITKQSPK
jgi:uncharacterized protein YkwD